MGCMHIMLCGFVQSQTMQVCSWTIDAETPVLGVSEPVPAFLAATHSSQHWDSLACAGVSFGGAVSDSVRVFSGSIRSAFVLLTLCAFLSCLRVFGEIKRSPQAT